MRRFSFSHLAPPAPVRKDVSSAWKVSAQDTVLIFAVAADGAFSVVAGDDVAGYCYLYAVVQGAVGGHGSGIVLVQKLVYTFRCQCWNSSLLE